MFVCLFVFNSFFFFSYLSHNSHPSAEERRDLLGRRVEGGGGRGRRTRGPDELLGLEEWVDGDGFGDYGLLGAERRRAGQTKGEQHEERQPGAGRQGALPRASRSRAMRVWLSRGPMCLATIVPSGSMK